MCYTVKGKIMQINNLIIKAFNFYLEGFRNMKLGKTLWIIILVTLFIIFGILKVFFFKDFLSENTADDKEIPAYVGEELIIRKIE